MPHIINQGSLSGIELEMTLLAANIHREGNVVALVFWVIFATMRIWVIFGVLGAGVLALVLG